jgi:hypothetical protein
MGARVLGRTGSKTKFRPSPVGHPQQSVTVPTRLGSETLVSTYNSEYEGQLL